MILIIVYLLFLDETNPVIIEPFFMKKGFILSLPFEYSIIRAINKKMVIVLAKSMTLCFLSKSIQKFFDFKLLQTAIFKVFAEFTINLYYYLYYLFVYNFSDRTVLGIQLRISRAIDYTSWSNC